MTSGRRLGHLTPTYVVDRLRQMADQRRQPDAPWLTADMVALLRQMLRPGDRGVEWGAGRSTVWFARRISHLTSIEESPKWVASVAAQLTDLGLEDKVDLRPIPAAAGDAYLLPDLAPQSVDFALVDGDRRDQCARAAIRLLKPGGLLIVDNVERYIAREQPSRAPNARAIRDGHASADWRAFAEEVASWRSIWTTDGVNDTALWIKPALNSAGSEVGG